MIGIACKISSFPLACARHAPQGNRRPLRPACALVSRTAHRLRLWSGAIGAGDPVCFAQDCGCRGSSAASACTSNTTSIRKATSISSRANLSAGGHNSFLLSVNPDRVSQWQLQITKARSGEKTSQNRRKRKRSYCVSAKKRLHRTPLPLINRPRKPKRPPSKNPYGNS